MAVPQNKAELLQAIDKEFQKLSALLDAIPSQEAGLKQLEGHAKDTIISVHDLVAYLVGWNELVLKWHRKKDAGEQVDFPETGYKWNQLGQLAQQFYLNYQDIPFEQLKEKLTTAKDHIVELINRYDDTALYGEPWYDKWTMGRMIQFNTSSPYANACGRLRKWLKSKT